MTDEPHLKLSDLQRCEVIDESGDRIGHLFDLATELAGQDEPPVMRQLLVGRAGLARRLGLWRGRADELSVDDVVAIRDGQVVVRRRPAG
jgi:sporulation protein YlmC with PRC-barrel domain